MKIFCFMFSESDGDVTWYMTIGSVSEVEAIT